MGWVYAGVPKENYQQSYGEVAGPCNATFLFEHGKLIDKMARSPSQCGNIYIHSRGEDLRYRQIIS